jgi:hypothetical protein
MQKQLWVGEDHVYDIKKFVLDGHFITKKRFHATLLRITSNNPGDSEKIVGYLTVPISHPVAGYTDSSSFPDCKVGIINPRQDITWMRKEEEDGNILVLMEQHSKDVGCSQIQPSKDVGCSQMARRLEALADFLFSLSSPSTTEQ